MATLAEFMPFVLPLVPGCPAPLAEQTLRSVALDFCSHAPLVQLLLDPVDVVAGQSQYDLDVPFGTSVSLVREASFHGRPMAVIKSDDEAGMYPNAAPYALRQAGDDTFTLVPTPATDDAGAIVLRVALRPSRLAAVLDDILLADYGYEIGAGTAARLMLMPGQLYSNPALAPTYQAIYIAARGEARVRAERSFGMAPSRARPRPFQ